MNWWPWRRRNANNGEAAKQAAAETQKRLRETRNDWPRVYQAADQMAELMAEAMRARRRPAP